jgi:CelD/BcsL family acetyltransferase involved in cellulose biosynthesis
VSTIASEVWPEEAPAPLSLRVQRVASLQALGTLATEWSELDARLWPRTPFTGPLWHQLWWKHYASPRLLVRDELFLHTVRDRRNRLVAVAPMMLTRRPSVGPVQARTLQCLGADGNITELRGLVCQPQDEGPVIAALARHFSTTAQDWDWIDWGGVRDDGTGGGALAGLGVIGWERQKPSYYLTLAPTWEEFRGQLTRNIKESLRKCYNSLVRDRHTFTLQVVDSPGQTPAALDTFFRLHRERARSNARIKHSDVFSSAKDRAFLADYAQRMAERDQLRIFQLEIGGRIVASRLGFLLGEDLYLYYSGYDMLWAGYSVMTTLLAEAIKWAIQQRLRLVGLSTGNDVSKLRWGPRSVVFRSALQVGTAWRSALAFRAYNQVLEAREHDSPLGKLLTVARR